MGYLNVLAFAKERVQGPYLTEMANKTAPRVRALTCMPPHHQDAAVAQQASGTGPDMAHRVNDLLLPVVKWVSSERAYEILSESLQTPGG